jgi:hypothetical protein
MFALGHHLDSHSAGPGGPVLSVHLETTSVRSIKVNPQFDPAIFSQL